MISKIVLLVEGLKDRDKINDAFRDFEGEDRVECLITEGTKFNHDIIDQVEEYIGNGYTPYILSDPDDAGDNLANMIQERYPEIQRLEVDPEQCGYFTGKKMKAGIEYSSHNYLRTVICPLIGIEWSPPQYPVCWDDV